MLIHLQTAAYSTLNRNSLPTGVYNTPPWLALTLCSRGTCTGSAYAAAAAECWLPAAA